MHINLRDHQLSFSIGGLQFRGTQPRAILIIGAAENLVEWRPSGRATHTCRQRLTPGGPATEETWRWNTPGGLALEWSVSRLERLPGFTLRAAFHNGTTAPVRLRELVLGEFQTDVAGKADDWWVSNLNYHQSPAEQSLAFTGKRALTDFCALYTAGGQTGLVIGAAGPPAAYARIELDGAHRLRILSEMTDVVVAPGETREGQEVLVLAAPFHDATTTLFRWLAATHGARTHRKPLAGWCSWYDLLSGITGPHVVAVANAVRQRRNQWPVDVIQIDEGYQRHWGDWRCAPKFPGGWPPVVKAIRAAGAQPGIWLAPLGVHDATGLYRRHPDWFQHGPGGSEGPVLTWNGKGHYLDPTHPAAQQFLRDVIRQARRAGFEYFKIDFNVLGQHRFHNPKLTRLQIFRELYRLYREELGEAAYLNACVFSLNRGVLGYCDAARIGGDSMAEWSWIARATIAVGGTAAANGILFAADPDVTYTRPRNLLTETERRSWTGFVGLLGGMTMCSEPLHQPAYQTAGRQLEILLPPSPERGRSFVAGTDPTHRQFGFVAERPWGRFAAIQLFNGAAKPARLTLGALPFTKFHVWSFWDERYLGVAAGFAQRLPAHGAVLLRLTPVSDEPVLVGSNLHISVGAAEIAKWHVHAAGIALELTDAGARAGKLLIHSRQTLRLARATGCRATVRRAGKLWTLHLRDRQRGQPQRIELQTGNPPVHEAVKPVRQRLEFLQVPDANNPRGKLRLTLENPGSQPISGEVLLHARPAGTKLSRHKFLYALAPREQRVESIELEVAPGTDHVSVESAQVSATGLLPEFRPAGSASPAAVVATPVRRVLRMGTWYAVGRLARVKLGVADGALVLEADVRDPKLKVTVPAWQGSCLEVFGTTLVGGVIGQVVLQPNDRAWQSRVGGQEPATDVRVTTTRTGRGYRLTAQIPWRRLAAEPGRLLAEIQVTVIGPADAPVRATLCGSTAAYADHSRYGRWEVQ